MAPVSQEKTVAIVERDDLQKLLDALSAKGYRIIGPTVRRRAITFDDVAKIDDLPVGWTEEQQGGAYRLKKRNDKALFGFSSTQRSWKNFLFPSSQRLLRSERQNGTFRVVQETAEEAPLALFGVRPCDLQAIQIQDKVLLGGALIDTFYKARREKAFVVAVNCGKAGGTCFCVSMGTGPRAANGFDLALTEIVEDPRHYFVVEAGSARGEEILRGIPHREASPEEKQAGEEVSAKAAKQMGRSMDTTDIKGLFYRNYENPRWAETARRCLTCTNCTMVCPTCFCSNVEDTTDLTGKNAERGRKLDSCFNLDFSYIHGGSIRVSEKSRYRQWITHKLAAWIDQFGVSGCVGCGRCITWCPVGIDLTEEVQAIRETK